MLEFSLHPGVYSTSSNDNLIKMLDKIWIKDHKAGDGHIYIISGYANFNGGIHFYSALKDHILKNGKITVIFSGDISKRLTSVQVVEKLLQCGAEVFIVNRKHLLHAKCYGVSDSKGQQLVVTSGNFTGPGMSRNGEASIIIDNDNLKKISFSWEKLISNIFQQNWEFFNLKINDINYKSNPGWSFLYDEIYKADIDESTLITMVITLNYSDIIRIQSAPGTYSGLDLQYFQLGSDAYDFFPPMTLYNYQGTENTYSCIVNIDFIDIGISTDCPVTYDVNDNNEFRLGTGTLRFTKIASENDIALITRISEYHYQLRIINIENPLYSEFISCAVKNAEKQNKYYGYITNTETARILSL